MYKNIKQIYLILILLVSIITFNMVRAQDLEPLREPEITNISNGEKISSEAGRAEVGSLGEKEARENGLPAVAGSAEARSLGKENLVEDVINISSRKYYSAVKEAINNS